MMFFLFFFIKVLAKGENTSAIYRLKITEKYAFVHTTSKLLKSGEIKSEPLDDMSESTTTSITTTTNTEPVIYSSHSIIK